MVILISIGIFIALLLILNLKTSRCDATLVKDVHPYRKILWYVIPTRKESTIYYDQYIRCDELFRYIKESKKTNPSVGLTQCIVAAIAKVVYQHPELNRFVTGYRMYQRNDLYQTFSMKRKSMNAKSKVTMVHLKMDQGESFHDLCSRIDKHISEERSNAITATDKELQTLERIPRPIFRLMVKLIHFLDYYNLLPFSFIRSNGFYTSFFIANLASIRMKAPFHHLYEWGNCPFFLTIGKKEDVPEVVKGEIKMIKKLHFRWTFDERVNDALTVGICLNKLTKLLENPFSTFSEQHNID
jgi:hypothetical protein